MDLDLTAEQAQLVQSVSDLLARHADPEQVRAAEAVGGFDPELWKRLSKIGIVAMAVDEAAGGWGASLLDLALVAEQLGRHVAPVPAIEAQVAARLLARAGTAEASSTLGAALDGSQLVTIAPRPARRGVASLVPAGSVADAAVVLDGDRLLLVAIGDVHRVANLGSMPVADLVVDNGSAVLAEGPEASGLHDAAVDEWLALTGAALVGIGARAVEVGVEYVKERKAWGVPIGTFQGVAHPLVDSATAVDGARLLAYEAAWAAAEAPDRAGELAAMAFAFSAESARDATYRSLHFHGGYGFMTEYDIQLYYRRARAWANVYAEPTAVYRRAADHRYGLEAAARRS